MSLADITLRVPAHRVSCAAWLHAQEPPAVADALSLCEVAFTAVRDNVAEGESAKIQAVHRLRIQELQDILQREKVVHAEEIRIIREKAESANEVLLRRHGEALEALRAQKGCELEEQQARARQNAENLLAAISSLEQSLNNAKATKQTAIDEAVERELSRLQGEHARQETHLQRQMESLQSELEIKRTGEAKALLAEKERHEAQLKARDENHAKDVEQHRSIESMLKGQLAKREADVERFNERLEKLVLQQGDVMLRYSGTATRGQLGEHTVADVFSRLQLGEYRDEHKQPEEGCADGLWVWQPSASVPLLSCIVEVKDSKVLHSLGMGKFHRDLRAATQSNHANAGLFLSLGARYPGKPPLQLTIEHGVPVCYASRADDDALPVPCMIEMAFRAMAEAWPLICRQRGEGVQLTVQAAAEQFEEQLGQCEALSKHIAKITKAAKSLLVDAKSLEKVRDNMVKGIEGVRVNHPSLVPEIPEGSLASSEGVAELLDPWLTPAAEMFVEAIRSAKRGTRYPKESDMTFEGEALLFYRDTPNAFVLAVDRLKKECGKGRKRKAEDPAEDEVREGDQELQPANS